MTDLQWQLSERNLSEVSNITPNNEAIPDSMQISIQIGNKRKYSKVKNH